MGTMSFEEAARLLLADMDKDGKERDAKSGDDRGKTRYYRIPNKEVVVNIRFLPGMHGAILPGHRVWTHYQIPCKEVSNIKCFKTYGMSCPMCDLLDQYRPRVGSKLLETWDSSLSSCFNALVLSDSLDSTISKILPVMLQFSDDFQYKWLINQCLNPQVGNITDLKTGAPVEFTRDRPDGKINRSIARMSCPIAATDEEIKVILDAAYDFSKMYRDPDAKYVTMMEKCVASVKRAIEEKILPMAGQNAAPPVGPGTTPPGAGETQTTQTQTASTPPVSKETETAGPKKPTCYGDKATYSPSRRECACCPWEFDCKKLIESQVGK